MSEPIERQRQLGRITLATLEWGDPSRPLALLAHGYPDTAWTWRHLGPRLAAQGWYVVAPFTRGYGPSDLAPDGRYFLSDLAGDLIALRGQLAEGRHAVLIGHDWGALTGWYITEETPDAFDSYVMLSVPPAVAMLTSARGPGGVPRFLHQLRRSWYFLYNQLPVQSRLDRAIPALWRDWSPSYDAGEDLPRVMRALDTPARRNAALGYYRANLKRGVVRTLSVRPGTPPALYLHGADDGCIGADVAAVGASLQGPHGRFESVPRAGHFVQLEQPDVVGELIEQWIGQPA